MPVTVVRLSDSPAFLYHGSLYNPYLYPGLVSLPPCPVCRLGLLWFFPIPFVVICGLPPATTITMTLFAPVSFAAPARFHFNIIRILHLRDALYAVWFDSTHCLILLLPVLAALLTPFTLPRRATPACLSFVPFNVFTYRTLGLVSCVVLLLIYTMPYA